MMTSDTLVRRLDGLVEARVDNEILALHVEQGNCYAFNVTAAHVWSLLEEPRRIGEIRDGLLASFEVDVETCERQVVEIIDQLVRQGLVTTISARRAGPGTS
jgi:hypothetical protein